MENHPTKKPSVKIPQRVEKINRKPITNPPKGKAVSLKSLFLIPSEKSKTAELFGFRRFARSYLIPSSKQRGRDLTNNPYDSIAKFSPSKKSYFNCISGLPPTEREEINHEEIYISSVYPITKVDKLEVKGELSEYKNISGGPEKMYTEDNDGDIEMVSSISSYRNWEIFYDRRSVTIENIPTYTGMYSILNQISGGPLEKFCYYRNENSRQATYTMTLNFLSSNNAQDFMKFGKTNLFKVNGFHLQPKWSSVEGSVSSQTNSAKSKLAKTGCICRYIILKRHSGKTTCTKVPILEYVDIQEIRKDFGCYGGIVEITPVISKKVCLSIGYYDIYSAVRAMVAYENSSTDLHKKYFQSWTLWYGNDISERPCLEI
ncbi:hypothetical protein NCAS_0B01600 [Naumovozyma castellii]|uniref:Uncharacterized protein n=1 Tax=Naumovozyma castellii TaxID=27288 RepID=G0VBB8_NAUCA|nr:hypothetical protein NCAS_0B01600 [Naumovozyma castellii CBS 4309]CCC68244.1 hypothetical protein NCAS_0B01600 [Naumovozyma castellii CBS 4309]